MKSQPPLKNLGALLVEVVVPEVILMLEFFVSPPRINSFCMPNPKIELVS